MRNITGPGDFLAWLGGADLKVLRQAPDYERTRFIQMALVLLTTSGIGTMSMIFALHNGVQTSLAVAIIGGLAWGFVILNLDRFLVLSMGHTRDWKRLLLMALPRLALAAVISLVVATPMTLRIFATDIQNEMVQVNATESKQVAQQQLESGPATQAATLLKQINIDKSIMAGHLQGTVSNPDVTTYQGQVNTLTPQVNAAQSTVDKDQAAYQCEVDGSGPGCEGASDKEGLGPIAQLKKTQLQQAQQKFQDLNNQLQTAQQHLQLAQTKAQQASGTTLQSQQKAAKAELPALQTQYDALEATVKKNQDAAEGAVEKNKGILAQLQDLSAAGANKPILKVAQWVVTLLFFCIEILPVTVKILLNMGPLSPYETLLKNEEDIITDRAKLTRVTRRRDAERESDKQIAIDEHMRGLEEKLGKNANDHVAQHMQAVLDVALDQWSKQVQAKLGVQAPTVAQPGTTGTATGQPAPGSPNGHGAAGPPGKPGSAGTGAATTPQPMPGANGNGNGNGNASDSDSDGTGGNGTGGLGEAPTITYQMPTGGYALRDDEEGDLL